MRTICDITIMKYDILSQPSVWYFCTYNFRTTLWELSTFQFINNNHMLMLHLLNRQSNWCVTHVCDRRFPIDHVMRFPIEAFWSWYLQPVDYKLEIINEIVNSHSLSIVNVYTVASVQILTLSFLTGKALTVKKYSFSLQIFLFSYTRRPLFPSTKG